MRIRTASFVAASAGCCLAATAQTVAPAYAANYSIVDLGDIPGLPGPYSAFCFHPGDPNRLLVGSYDIDGAIYQIAVVRNGSGNIIGFSGTATQVSTAPGIEDGLTFGPLTILLYASYDRYSIGQIKPGSTSPDRLIDLFPLNMNGPVGAVIYVPAGNPGAGLLKFVSVGGEWYSASLALDAHGTFDLIDITRPAQISVGIWGVGYVTAASPQFNSPRSILVYELANIVAYDVDTNGDPIAATQRDFITNIGGGVGAAVDPVTGQFLFGCGAGLRVMVIRGFGPPRPCYPNCDDSTTLPVLNIADSGCFLNKYAAGDNYANCDGSTTAPVLNVADFVCFLNRFAAGCS